MRIRLEVLVLRAALLEACRGDPPAFVWKILLFMGLLFAGPCMVLLTSILLDRAPMVVV